MVMTSKVPLYLCGVILSLMILIVVHGDTEQSECEVDIENSKCGTDIECLRCYNGSFCNAGKCNCTDDLPLFISKSEEVSARCLPAVNLSGICEETKQCLFLTDYTICDSNKCICKKEYFVPEGESVCKREEPSPLVPIIVASVLAGTIILTLLIYFIRIRGSGGSSAGVV